MAYFRSFRQHGPLRLAFVFEFFPSPLSRFREELLCLQRLIPYMGLMTCRLFIFLKSSFARGYTWANKACLAWLKSLSGDVPWYIKTTNRWMSLKQVSDRIRGSSDSFLNVCVIAGYDFQVSKQFFFTSPTKRRGCITTCEHMEKCQCPIPVRPEAGMDIID